jgi:aldehyde dehydrogenase (NAD+)
MTGQRFKQIYIGGRWVDSLGTDVLDVRSPHDGKVFAHAPQASVADADRAVAAARAAFDNGPWPHLAPAERIAAVERLVDQYTPRIDEMAALITSENGSTITFSRLGQAGSIPYLISGFLDAARSLGWEEERSGPMGTSRIIHEPVGVVVAITAWNVPQILILGKLVPALLAGCTVVVNASPDAPLDALTLAEIVDAVGLPPGVVSISSGGPTVGRHLVAHPDVDKVTFTGSTAVGREIGRVCGEQFKRVSLELGGKSAAIVLDDANLERTVAGLKFASFVNNGQACAAQTRVLAPRSRYGDVVDALTAGVEELVVGDPRDEASEIGPLVNRRQYARVRGYIDIALAEGARRVTGETPLPDELAAGNYVAPTLFVDVDSKMRIAQEEVFGPVLVVIPYEDEDDAVRIANDSMYGLAGSIWTKDKAHGYELARRIRTGMIGLNRFGPDTSLPFGGFKASGIGREYGLDGLLAFTETKTVHGL